MILEFSIVGGYLKIPKNVLVQEMLGKESLLRSLLNWKTTKAFSDRQPRISQPDKDNIVTIDFSGIPDLNTGENPKEILSALKARHKEKIKGNIACRTVYSMYGGIFTYSIDLNSDDEKVEYIMN